MRLKSLIGAVYLDAGLEQAQISVEEIFEEELSAIDPRLTAKDPKNGVTRNFSKGRECCYPNIK